MAKSKISYAAIRTLMSSEKIDDAVHNVAKELLAVANQIVPVVSGNLRRSGHVEKIPEGYAVIYDAPYARAVHDGSRPRIIKAKNKPYLVWKDKNGKWHSAKQVNYPGIKNNTRWLDKAIKIMETRNRP